MDAVTISTYKVTGWDWGAALSAPCVVPAVAFDGAASNAVPNCIVWNDPPDEASTGWGNPFTLVGTYIFSGISYYGGGYQEAQEEYRRLLKVFQTPLPPAPLKSPFGADLVYHVNSGVSPDASTAWVVECKASEPAEDAEALTEEQLAWLDRFYTQVAVNRWRLDAFADCQTVIANIKNKCASGGAPRVSTWMPYSVRKTPPSRRESSDDPAAA